MKYGAKLTILQKEEKLIVSDPVYGDKYLKTKIKSYNHRVPTNFSNVDNVIMIMMMLIIMIIMIIIIIILKKKLLEEIVKVDKVLSKFKTQYYKD